MCKAMLRFQEHYESPNDDFRGKVFTLGVYRKWYTEKEGAFSYYADWGGFNWPDYVLDPFLEGLFDPLLPEEEVIVNLLRHVPKPFYVIGTSGEEALDHEIAHALYYLNKNYRSWVNEQLKDQSALKGMRKWLKEQHYHESVFIDEQNAYLATDQSYLDQLDAEYPIELAQRLEKRFRRYKAGFYRGL
jgi:hypothetical protein